MKKIILIFALAFLSCNKSIQEQPSAVYEEKYPYGTVMYAKPDSVKVVISQFDPLDNTYKAYWREGAEYATAWYAEEGFYGEAETPINNLY